MRAKKRLLMKKSEIKVTFDHVICHTLLKLPPRPPSPLAKVHP
jgi:hypothetical protein